MLSKLLKYELRASGRILLPVYALLLASAGCCSLFYKLAADHPYRTGAASVLMGLLNVAFWIFVVATGAITALLMIYRFYKTYMTDEGYLMFTLPVNRHQLIWSKLLSALLYTAASAVAVTLSILLVLLPIADWSGFWGNLGELLSSITESLHFGVPGPLLLLWIAVLAILTVFSGFLMVYAAIALGHSFSNHKILLSVVFFIAFSLAMQAAGLTFFSYQLTIGETVIESGGSAASTQKGLPWAGRSFAKAVPFNRPSPPYLISSVEKSSVYFPRRSTPRSSSSSDVPKLARVKNSFPAGSFLEKASRSGWSGNRMGEKAPPSSFPHIAGVLR